MRRFALAALAAFGCAFAAQAAQDGVPVRPLSLGNWYDHDPVQPVPGYEPWTPSDVAGFLALHPDAYFEIGYGTVVPGSSKTRDKRRLLDELRTAAAQRGVDTGSRLCLVERPDVFQRFLWNSESCAPWRGGGGCDWEATMQGRHGEAETAVKATGRATSGTANALVDDRAHFQTDLYVHRILVLRPGGADEERRRIVQNEGQMLLVDANWSQPPLPGDPYQVLGSFDTAWIRRVSVAAHQAAVQRYWADLRNVCNGPCAPPAEPLDPFLAKRGFEAWIDGDTIGALRTATTVPALWGYVYDGDQLADNAGKNFHDPYFRANSVVMDLSSRAYRLWRAQYLLYVLEDLGFQKDDDVCLLVQYKPGFHTWNDPSVDGVMDHPCADPQSHNWIGPAHICPKGLVMNGAFHGTPYGPGEFQTAISAYFRDLFATTGAQGWKHIRVITAEAPPYGPKNWTVLADDVRRLSGMYGEEGGWIEPKLAELAGAPPATGATGTDAAPPAPTGSTSDSGTASTTAAPPPASPPPAAPPTSDGATSDVGGATPRSAQAPSPAPSAEPKAPQRRGYVTTSDGGLANGTALPPSGAEPEKPQRGGYVMESDGGLANGTLTPPSKDR